MATIATLQADRLTGEIDDLGGHLSVRFAGTGDLRTVVELDQFLTTLHREAEARQVREVIVDLKQVEFLNSSCFKAFVSWLGRLQDSKGPYHVRLLSSSKYHWQKRSLHALRCFAAEHVTIE
jgi:anti-anti-sigma factor